MPSRPNSASIDTSSLISTINGTLRSRPSRTAIEAQLSSRTSSVAALSDHSGDIGSFSSNLEGATVGGPLTQSMLDTVSVNADLIASKARRAAMPMQLTVEGNTQRRKAEFSAAVEVIERRVNGLLARDPVTSVDFTRLDAFLR